MPVIEGARFGYTTAGAPVAGTDEIQTLTIGGTPTGGSFTLTFEGFTTAAIAWTATDATLIADIQAKLEALPNIGTGNLLVTDTTMTSGIGNATLTFRVAMGKKAVGLVVATNSLTGTSPTVVVADTTPGVDASARGAPIGGTLTDTTNGKLYINTGTPAAPTWTVVGAQT